jgi:hypothetical protein
VNSTVSTLVSGSKAAHCRRQISGEFPIKVLTLYNDSPFVASWLPKVCRKPTPRSWRAVEEAHQKGESRLQWAGRLGTPVGWAGFFCATF